MFEMQICLVLFFFSELATLNKRPESLQNPNTLVQPDSIIFLKRHFGQRSWAFRNFWFKRWPWIYYDVTDDMAYFCQPGKETVIAKHRFSFHFWWQFKLEKCDWLKEGLYQAREFSRFKETVLKVITLSQATLDVGETLSHLHRKEKAFNRQMLLKIISNIRFLARKGPAIRGDGLEMGREANSYFTRLMHLRGEDDPRLLDWKTRKSNK